MISAKPAITELTAIIITPTIHTTRGNHSAGVPAGSSDSACIIKPGHIFKAWLYPTSHSAIHQDHRILDHLPNRRQRLTRGHATTPTPGAAVVSMGAVALSKSG
jgi:hypothetical protein